MSIIVCYTPTNDIPEERKDEYYDDLQSVVDENPESDMKIVIGDFNAKVGKINQGMEIVMGDEGLCEVVSENGDHLMSFCSANKFVIRGNLFQHKDIHKYAWTSPYGNYKN
ncbi:craniofacial development protein 2-like [Palaemon carinicauda]|uniref:craniofacial development protein 2-like n=1 Tax=Palaemon carinicauda TaxID=392227 RepID=UPI0035B5D448